MRVFREFIKRSQIPDGTEIIDARDVISRECYDLWVSTRKILPPNPEKAFQRSLSAHVTGVDGRVPFTPQEEDAVLKVLRRKERWPCFEASSTRFGLMGFRAKGFHEKSTDSSQGGDDQGRKRQRLDDSSVSSDNDSSTADYPSSKSAEPATTQFAAVAGNLLSLANALGRRDNTVIDVPQLTQSDGSFSFLDAAHALLNRHYVAGVDAWSTVMSIARMMMVSKGWAKSPVNEDVQHVLREYCERFVNAPIVIVDPLSRQMKDKILAMSPAAQLFLGPVARFQNGLDRRIIQQGDGWSALTAAYSAFKKPGVEFAANINISCVDGVSRPVIAYFCAFASERLIVVRAVPLA